MGPTSTNAPRHVCSLHACAIPFVRAALANGEMEDPLVIYWWSKTAELDARLTGIALAELDVRLVWVTTQSGSRPGGSGPPRHPLDA